MSQKQEIQVYKRACWAANAANAGFEAFERKQELERKGLKNIDFRTESDGSGLVCHILAIPESDRPTWEKVFDEEWTRLACRQILDLIKNEELWGATKHPDIDQHAFLKVILSILDADPEWQHLDAFWDRGLAWYFGSSRFVR